MRKILQASIILILIYSNSWSQCTPSWPTGGGAGISPDSATNLPHAVEGLAYNTTIQFKAPHDTTYFGQPVTIDSITINSVTGLSTIPNISPFTYVPNPANGVFLGGTVNCINITGTPSIGSQGTYPLNVNVTASAHFNAGGSTINVDYAISFYKIIVDINTAVPSINKNKFDLAQNFPNPFSTKTSISFNLQGSSMAVFKVYDLIGNVLYEKTIDGKPGVNTISYDGSELGEGVYFYSISSGTGTLTRRLIIERK